ncbi:hypothetical protein A4X13_0g9402, partial [Tilletia indica]
AHLRLGSARFSRTGSSIHHLHFQDPPQLRFHIRITAILTLLHISKVPCPYFHQPPIRWARRDPQPSLPITQPHTHPLQGTTHRRYSAPNEASSIINMFPVKRGHPSSNFDYGTF